LLLEDDFRLEIARVTLCLPYDKCEGSRWEVAKRKYATCTLENALVGESDMTDRRRTLYNGV
jgi:hypothetical protein